MSAEVIYNPPDDICQCGHSRDEHEHEDSTAKGCRACNKCRKFVFQCSAGSQKAMSLQANKESVMQIDWNDPNLSDEAVVRAWNPEVFMSVKDDATGESDGIWIKRPPYMREWVGTDWHDARTKHPAIIAFEQANRPDRKDCYCDPGKCILNGGELQPEFTCKANRPAQAPAKESGRDLWIATRALKLATQDTDFAKSGYWLEIATSQWATQSGERVEAAGDGFEEWFEQRHPKPKQFGFGDLYNHEFDAWEELRNELRAAWTASAERGKR